MTTLRPRAAAATLAVAFTVLWMLDRVIAGLAQCAAAGSCPQ